ncbi:zf-TFIIB domain-containing protein [Agromyces allii]|uniref:Transcription factor zinc-finger domain-containing protein n=1 Tax=Agromyces allii TaxID=393607 RepID=A0ABN2PZU1_9MICO|nr:zf-TFIIB domain-containing protein [Agromyces allii]
MQCPNDGAVLVMSERSGIEIDYCPTCRGVWLDRGELDKIIERAANDSGAAPAAPAPAQPAFQQPAPPAYQPPAQPQYGQPAYGQQPPAQPQYGQPAYGQQPYDNRGQDGRGYDNRGYGDQGYRKKKKDNWLSDLFD